MTNPTNDFCVFILTHGRPNKIYTLKTLKKQGYTGPLFFICDDEDAKLDRYKELYGDKVIVFNKKEVAETFDEADNFYKDRRTIVYARNFCFQAARQLGFKYFLELDDDYIHFRFTLDKFKNYTVQMCKNLDEVFNIFLTYFKSIPAKSIAMAQGGDILGGGKSKTLRNGKIKRKAMNTFFCSVDRPFQFVGRINEDVNTYVSLGAVGEIFMTLTNICITQNQTQKTKGGMTEVYLNSGTYLKSFYSVMFAPSAVQIAVMGDKEKRIHHRVNWKFAAPLIIRESLKK